MTSIYNQALTATCRPLLQRVWLDFRAALADARVARRARLQRRAEMRLLATLSNATLRDVGLAHCLSRRAPTLPLLDIERGRW